MIKVNFAAKRKLLSREKKTKEMDFIKDSNGKRRIFDKT
jgi:hypothetical protein